MPSEKRENSSLITRFTFFWMVLSLISPVGNYIGQPIHVCAADSCSSICCVWCACLTHSGVSIRHQDDHRDGARVDHALIGCLHQHLNCSHQCLVDVGTWR